MSAQEGGFPYPTASVDAGRRVPVLLDTDIGSNADDLLALVMAATAPEIDLVGVTTVYGDTALRARIASHVLGLLDRDDVPVAAGARRPRSGRPVFWTGHEGAGLGDLEALPPRSPSALRVFMDALDEHGDALVVVAIGPLTNVVGFAEHALAEGERIGCVVVMGGQFGDGEPDRNVASDAVAAHRLSTLGVPTVYVGIDVCRQVALGVPELDAFTDNSDVGMLMRGEVERWWRYLGRRTSSPCDPLTVLALLRPGLFRFVPAHVGFVASGPNAGSTVWSHDSATTPVAHVAAALDRAAATLEITRRLANAVTHDARPHAPVRGGRREGTAG